MKQEKGSANSKTRKWNSPKQSRKKGKRKKKREVKDDSRATQSMELSFTQLGQGWKELICKVVIIPEYRCGHM